MKIWHQSFTVLSDLPAYEAALRQRAKAVLGSQSEIEFHGQLPGTYPSDYPGDDIGFGFTYQLHGQQWVAAARAAEKQGFDVYAMCTLPNPMLREIRSIVDIPVVGLGECAFHVATMYGQRFAVLLFIDRMIPLYQEQIRDYGLASRCGAVTTSGLSFADVLAGFTDPGPALERFEDNARSIIASHGVDVIIPGEVPLNMLLSANGMHRVDDVPIIDSYAVTLKMAEMFAELRQLSGMTASRHGFMNSIPSQERLDDVLTFYGLDRLSFD
ncbi:MAG: aspartate/glutamate racemase family protein [Pseudomonadota bacterium]